jgi:hypothetical protein
VAGAISGNIFEFWGSVWKFVDCGLISQKGRGAICKMVQIFLVRIYFPMEKFQWTRSTTRGPLVALVHSEPWPWSAEELTGAWPSGRSGAGQLTGDSAMERREHGESVSGLTRARVAVWRPSNGVVAE